MGQWDDEFARDFRTLFLSEREFGTRFRLHRHTDAEEIEVLGCLSLAEAPGDRISGVRGVPTSSPAGQQEVRFGKMQVGRQDAEGRTIVVERDDWFIVEGEIWVCLRLLNRDAGQQTWIVVHSEKYASRPGARQKYGG